MAPGTKTNSQWGATAWTRSPWGWSNSWEYQGSWGWSSYPWKSSSSQAGSSGEAKPLAPEILPDFVQGWFLLQDAGLDVHERNVVQTALRGDFSLQRVAAELRAQWPDHEVQKRDRGGRHGAYLGDAEDEDDEDHQGSPDLAWLAEEGLGEEGMALMTQAETTAQEAMAAIANGRRTLREARAKQHEVRMARRYYKTSSGTRGGSQGSGARAGGRDDSHLTCLKCGKLGHRAANCTERKEEQAKVVEAAPLCLLSG